MSTQPQSESGNSQPAPDSSLLGPKGDPVEGQRHIPEGPTGNESEADEAAEEGED